VQNVPCSYFVFPVENILSEVSINFDHSAEGSVAHFDLNSFHQRYVVALIGNIKCSSFYLLTHHLANLLRAYY